MNDSTTQEKLLEKAFQTLDIEMLKIALSNGADVNYIPEDEDLGLLEEAIYQYGCDYIQNLVYPEEETTKLLDIQENTLIEFIEILSIYGYNFNRIFKGFDENISTFYVVSIWGYNTKIVEKLLQKGMRPHIYENGSSDIDEVIYKANNEKNCGYEVICNRLMEILDLTRSFLEKQ